MTNPFRIAGGEFRRFHGLMPVLALTFVTAVPLMYGAIYLAANWDPYGRLSDLPVAVVNQDRPTKAEGRTVAAGDDFVTELKDDGEFDWHEVDADTAATGLAEGDYYLVVTVPEDFSGNLVSGQTDDPQRAHIQIRRNDANGFVIGSITGQAQTEIEEAVDQSAVQSYFEVVFDNLATIKSGLNEAASGSGELDGGLGKADAGAGKLASGSTELATGADQLETGSATLASGLGTASEGADSLSSGLTTLEKKSGELATGADQVADGTQQLRDTVVPPLSKLETDLPKIRRNAKKASTAMNDIADQAAGGGQSVSEQLGRADADLTTLAEKHPELSDDPAFQRLSDRVDAASRRAGDISTAAQEQADAVAGVTDGVQDQLDGLSGTVKSAKKKVNRLNDGAHQVASGAHRLNTGIASASTGADSLADGVGDASSGATELNGGAVQLSDGADQLKTGAADLNTALGQLSEGAGSLHDSLASSAKKVPAVTEDQQTQAAQVLSSPARADMVVDNAATYYGRGLAPMFFSIALWVFGITAFLILRPFAGRTLLGRGNLIARQFGSWLPAGALATLGGFLTVGTVWLGLGLDPVRPWAFLGITVLGAVTFSMIAQVLRMALNVPGSAVLLLWLILQLATTGGTYPAAVLPEFFAALNPYMPMTYLIDAYRVTISGGESSHLLTDVAVIGSIAVVTFVIGVAVMWRKQRLASWDLHPFIEEA